ncbi:MAG: protein kinase [Myxococcales bacterium]|nr:protein kinase [Myxococcales bacterium]
MNPLPQLSTRYNIKKLLGAGGMGVTYLATQGGSEGFEKRVVLKRLHPNLMHDPAMVKALIAEAHLAVKLDHPNIVSIHDLFLEKNEYTLVMEYIDGCPLSYWMQSVERLEPEIVLCVVMQLLLALHYAHQRKDEHGNSLHIIHRDISPDNILLSHNGTAKLTDFGLAKIRTHAELTQPGTIKGKYGYMSPEQARGMRLDQRTDLYSVGILLYEGLTGQRLFHGQHPLQTLRLTARGEIRPINEAMPNLSPSLVEIVHKALDPDPDKRFQSAAAFYDALEIFALPWSLEKMRRLLEESLQRFLATKASEKSENTEDRLVSATAEGSVSRETSTIKPYKTQSQNSVLAAAYKKPLVYVICNDSMITEGLQNQLTSPWIGRKHFQVELLDKKEDIDKATELIDNLERVPNAVIFGGLHVALQHPLLASIRKRSNTLKIMLLPLPQPDIMELAVELCGVSAAHYGAFPIEELINDINDQLSSQQTTDRLHQLQKRLESSSQIEIEMRSRVDALASANVRAAQLVDEVNQKNKQLEEKDHFLQRVSRTLLNEEGQIEASGCFLQGELNEMPLTDIFQLLNLSRKSACVTFLRDNESQHAQLFFQQGEVIHARYGALQGERVIELLLNWSNAHFMLQALPPTVERTITQRTDQLLLDLLRRIDEERRPFSAPSSDWELPEGDVL